MNLIANTIAVCLIFVGLVVSAEDSHREHGAHVHGSATLAIAFDQSKGHIEFKTAAWSILGFEHAAHSEKDKKILSEARAKFEKEISKLIAFSPALNCHLKLTKVEQVPESAHSQHSNFLAQYDVECAKSPKGSQLKIDFSQFAALKDLDITVLIEELQITAEAKGKALQLDLK